MTGSNLGQSCLSVNQYQSLFGDKGIMMDPPSYVPAGYALQCINVSGPNPSETDFISFYYYKADQEFKTKFLPKIQTELQGHPMYASWLPEFYDGGGILVTRSIEYIENGDPRYDDKLRHFEIERAISDPLNDCSFANFTHGICQLKSDYLPPELANGNPVTHTFVDLGGSRVEGLQMYMDHNWLVYLMGPSDSDELFKMAETIHR